MTLGYIENVRYAKPVWLQHLTASIICSKCKRRHPEITVVLESWKANFPLNKIVKNTQCVDAEGFIHLDWDFSR